MHAHVCLRPDMLVPLLMQIDATFADYFEGAQEAGDVESRGKYDYIKFFVHARLADDTGGIES